MRGPQRKERIREFTRDEMEEIYRKYVGMVSRIARSMCRNPTDVEDWVQESFMAISERVGLYNEENEEKMEFHRFIAMIAVSRCLQLRRAFLARKRREKQVAVWVNDHGEEKSAFANMADKAARDPSKATDQNFLLERVRVAMNNLGEKRRQAIQLRMKGLQFNEIGAQLDVTKERARQLHHDGMSKLQMWLRAAKPDSS